MADTVQLVVHIPDTSPVGITAPAPSVAAVVYPNPTADSFTIVINGCMVRPSDGEVTLTSSDGRSYGMQHFADLPSGLYVVRVVHHGHLHVGKVVKR